MFPVSRRRPVCTPHSIFRSFRTWLFSAAFTCLVLTLFPASLRAEEGTDIIEQGVAAEGFDLSGMTSDEALSLLDGHFRSIAESSLTVTFDNQSVSVRPADLGFTWDSSTVIREASGAAKSGRLIELYKAREDLKHNHMELVVPRSFSEEKIRQFVTSRIASLDTEPRDASMVREDGAFVVTPEVNGKVTDVDATVQAISDVLTNELSDQMTVEAAVQLTKPEITAEYLSLIQDKLGSYNTDYSSSRSSRKTNIKVAAGRLNGTLLMPGQQLSVSEAIGDRNAENGYELAPQYENGTSVDSYGGGVCQVSTTLYNAVIRAELQIDERHPHSMTVHYVPYSSDAAIAEGNKDFKFTNNTDYAVFIASAADGETLYFSIYGHETRPANRTVEFVSKTLSYSEPKPKTKKDPKLASGKTVVKGSTHADVRSTLTKVVSVNGEEVSREVLNEDHYVGVAKTIYKGTGKKAAKKKTKKK